jgi:ribosomal protein S18 acetylase RimI-like enzyme
VDTPWAGWSATGVEPFEIRDYRDSDEESWLRCRVLSFLDSSYYDDVLTTRTPFEGGAVRLVAVRPRPPGVTTAGEDEVVGILDVELFPGDGPAEPFATIDTVAVHPDHRRRGVADALLRESLARLAGTPAVLLDAWTRQDRAAGGWYEANGFTERYRYAHVHKEGADPDDGFSSPEGLSAPVKAFAHGRIEDLEKLRGRYRRVYVCRRMVRSLP